ncbi:MAG: hypothetical protein Q7J29_12940 [Stagnimonas sp.]|nr:hypothetical protein [Stagnimonas sp.]
MTVIQYSIPAGEQNAVPGISGSPSQGVVRVQMGSSTEATAALPSRGATANDYSTVERVSSADVVESGDMHAVSPTGRPLAPSEIKADSIVTVGGHQMKAALAERLGLLVRDHNGYRSNAPSANVAAPQRPQDAPQTEGDASAAPALAQTAAASLEALNAGGGDTQRAAVEYLDTGEVSASATARLASRLGIEPQQVQQHVANVAEGFRAQAAAIIGGDEVLALAAHLDPAAADRAARDHALRGDLSSYAALAAKATDHVIQNAASVESTDADIRVRSVSGKHLVSGPGIPGEIDLRQAVRLGFVTVAVQR